MRTIPSVILISGLLIACSSSPLDRRQVTLFSEEQLAAQGEAAYEQMRQEIPLSTNQAEVRYVACVADHIVDALSEQQRGGHAWEITVFDDEPANAFALPGGKMGVFNGLLDVAVNQHQLAAVVAHEIAHVISNHSNERASQSALRSVGVAAAQVLGASNATLQAIDLGAQLGLLLPFSRTQESEADVVGLMLMAEAGFDPRQSIALWENMEAVGGSRPPEFMSTHPSPGSRIEGLRARMDSALALRQDAMNRGNNPDCTYSRGSL